MSSRVPQWSPPTKGGRTAKALDEQVRQCTAAMEPAYERRENQFQHRAVLSGRHAAMEPAYERRENRQKWKDDE